MVVVVVIVVVILSSLSLSYFKFYFEIYRMVEISIVRNNFRKRIFGSEHFLFYCYSIGFHSFVFIAYFNDL